jgi:hypothetical protein
MVLLDDGLSAGVAAERRRRCWNGGSPKIEAKIERSVSRVLSSCFLRVELCFSLASIIIIVSVNDGIYIPCAHRPARLWKDLAGEHVYNDICYSKYYHTIRRDTRNSVP